MIKYVKQLSIIYIQINSPYAKRMSYPSSYVIAKRIKISNRRPCYALISIWKFNNLHIWKYIDLSSNCIFFF